MTIELTALIQRLRGYNPPDRTVPEQRQIAIDIRESADALEGLMAEKQKRERYSAPFQTVGGKLMDVPIHFVSHRDIHDKPTEANPSPVRVIVVYELEDAQPSAMLPAEPNAAPDEQKGEG